MDQTPALILTSAALFLSLAGAISSSWASRSRRHRRDRPEPSAPTLEDRIDRLQTQMKTSANLIEQISAEMDVRAKVALTLKAEAEQARQLASLHEEQRQAVVRAVGAEMAAESKRTGRQNLRANILFFVAGVLVSVIIQLVVKPL